MVVARAGRAGSEGQRAVREDVRRGVDPGGRPAVPVDRARPGHGEQCRGRPVRFDPHHPGVGADPLEVVHAVELLVQDHPLMIPLRSGVVHVSRARLITGRRRAYLVEVVVDARGPRSQDRARRQIGVLLPELVDLLRVGEVVDPVVAVAPLGRGDVVGAAALESDVGEVLEAALQVGVAGEVLRVLHLRSERTHRRPPGDPEHGHGDAHRRHDHADDRPRVAPQRSGQRPAQRAPACLLGVAHALPPSPTVAACVTSSWSRSCASRCPASRWNQRCCR